MSPSPPPPTNGARFQNKIPWWVPEELSGDAAWDYVAGYMAAPIRFRGEEPDEADDTPTNPDISRRAA